ncbi:MAG: beta-galactosidase [Ferruginibacter sp.]
MIKLKVTIYCLVLQLLAVHAQQKHSFQIKGSQFVYDGRPIQIHSGEMHFARIPRAYWRHRLQMLKAMGLNTVATYVFWNYHNTAPGVWDFKTGNRDIAAFIRTAREVGLFVMLRPGPYACAEWEFGGYPWWLQKDTTLVIRAYNKAFLDSCKVYIGKLAEQVKDLLVTRGGPVIMVQAENEFGSYVSQRKDIPIEQHKKYNLAIKQLLVDAGFDVPLFTSDGSWLFEGGSLEGILPTANGEDNIDNLKKAVNKYHHDKGPYMVAEYYPGWLHHWGEPFPDIPAKDVVTQLEKYLKNGVSFNIYMAHGGTNFGFMAGANYNDDHDIQPDLTTYNYDAPISEPGWSTPKYLAIRDLMKKYVNYPLPGIPRQIPVITVPAIRLNQSVDLFSLKSARDPLYKSPILSDTVLSFEDINQAFGYLLYSKKFTRPIQGQLTLKGLRDFAVVYINGEKKGVLNRIDKKYTLDIDIPLNGVLDILVENMGRINYGAAIIHNKKGIITPVLINDIGITGGWEIYPFPFSAMPILKEGKSPAREGRPALFSGTFIVKAIGDIFLDMRSWGKGILFVNGFNLGRYWNIGPQQTLYLPGAFLKKGNNEILIFEQLNDNVKPVIPTLASPLLKDLKISR